MKCLKKYLAMVPPAWKKKGRIFGEACEFWVESTVRCTKCDSTLTKCTANQKSIDMVCSGCGEEYQVKCSQKPFLGRGEKIKFLGAEYNTTIASMGGGNPKWNLILVKYEEEEQQIERVLLIGKENITEKNVIPRNPLGPNARRAGWQGCNFQFDVSSMVEKKLE